MDKEILQIFNIIGLLKNTKKTSYVIGSEDMFIIYNYWHVYGLHKHMTLKKFRKAVVNYSVGSGKTLHSSCEELCKKLNLDK